ncbi:MAG: hypothetical protein QX203_08540 [Methylococcaceae bacterium]
MVQSYARYGFEKNPMGLWCRLFKCTQQTADVLGWSRGKVSQYDMLDNISKEAWAIIATTFEEQEKLPAKSSVAANATVVAFSERLLRDIINLSDSQQLELVRDFAAGTINKNKFTKLAEQYKQMNADALSLRVIVVNS